MRPTGGTVKARTLVVDAVLVAVASVAILVPVLELWDAHLNVPFAYVRGDPLGYAFEPDAPYYQLFAKGGIDHAWYLTNADLGAPFRQQLYDFPVTLDNLNLLQLKVVGLVTNDAATTVNLFYLATFATAAVAMLLVLRALRVSRGVAGVVALLYAFLPYHFARGEPHLFLSAYWIVPLACYLLIRIVSAQPPFTSTTEGGAGWRVQWRDRSALLWFLVCVAIASSGAYYTGFALLLLVVLVAADYLARRRVRVVVSGAIAMLAILSMTAFNLAPDFVWWLDRGRNTAVVRRGPAEAEREGLKIAQLVLPVADHRVDALADVQEKSTRRTPTRSEPGQQLGVIGAAGLVGVLVASFVAIRRRRRDDEHDEMPPPPSDVMGVMGVLTVTAIVVAAISGFAMLLFGIGIRELRAWNRISVFIAFFAFTAVAFGLDWIGRWLARRRIANGWWRYPAAAFALGALLVVGILDQVSPAVIPDYEATAARWHSDDAFVARIERRMPAGAEIFELPFRFYPEAPVVARLGPYDLGRMYLHSNSLRWSWGGMSGREADWQASTAVLPVGQMLDRIAAVGFSGLVYDVGSEYDGGQAKPEEITEALGQPPLVSRDRELLFWDLRDRRRALQTRLGDDGVRRLREEALADRRVPANPEVVTP